MDAGNGTKSEQCRQVRQFSILRRNSCEDKTLIKKKNTQKKKIYYFYLPFIAFLKL